ncbi:TolC family protein [uncultured Clostridium sp.]|uniref:TolC family protein n=1 Tax=uncultured Clostridium sp. TaxID=59620 RepID=UPI0025D790A1|nr:TolC family protein [uncultured Clostridium sp.]
MRRNLNKIVAFAIGVSVISGSIIPAMAETKVTYIDLATINQQKNQASNKPVLSLEDAMETAVSNSETLSLLDKTISYTEKINDVTEKINNVSEDNDMIEDYEKDYTEEKNDLSIKALKQKRDYQEDILKTNVRDSYNQIVTKQVELESLKLNLDIQNKRNSDMKLKNSLGLATSIDTEDFDLNIQKMKNGIKTSEDSLKLLQYKFKNLTGIDVSKYTLNRDIEYDKFEIDGSVEEYLDDIVEQYIEESLKQEQIDNEKDYLDELRDDVKITSSDKAPKKDEYYSTVTNDDGTESRKFDAAGYKTALSDYISKLSNYAKYLGSKLSNISDQTTLNEEKKAFKEALRQYYILLINTENTIELDKKNIELNNQKLKNTKLQYDLGQITKDKYDEAVKNNLDLESELRTDIEAYNQYKDNIQKPWLKLTIQ